MIQNIIHLLITILLFLQFNKSALAQSESYYLKKWSRYIQEDIDSCLVLSKSISDNSMYKIHIKKLILGTYLIRKGGLENGLELLQHSAIYYTQNQNHEILCRIYNEMGIGFFLSGDLNNAEKFFNYSMQEGQKSYNEADCFLAQLNLAKCYYELDQEHKASFYIKKYLEYAYENNKWESASNANGVLFEIALNKGQLKTAKKYIDKQLNFALKSKSKNFYLHALTNKGILLFEQGLLDSAVHCFEHVLLKRKHENNPIKVFDAYYNMAAVLLETDSINSDFYIDSAFNIALRNKHYYLAQKAVEFIQIESKKNVSDSIQNRIQMGISKFENANLKMANKLLNTTKAEKAENRIYIVWMLMIPIMILFSVYLYRIRVRKP